MHRKLTARYVIEDLLGESGTGKKLVAQGIHNASARREFAFVALNCGAFPETLLERAVRLRGGRVHRRTSRRQGATDRNGASRGTLFLDEIAEMPLPLQIRLLRVLLEREVVRLGSTESLQVDVRIVAATHRALIERVQSGEFCADLYYRLNILNLSLPPLRERAADIALLAKHLLGTARATLNDDAIALLTAYRWPGNVRELQNVMERIAMELDDVHVTAAQLIEIAPEVLTHSSTDELDLTLKARAKRTQAKDVRAVLESFDGDREKACAALSISKTTLWRKLNGMR